ncbi:bifunctional metallophosphatase/5'-nucleotidase [Rathayibacter sp. VKM Ac-2759]|uniref:bifunctional metallophosphatase/5'-nucleotidase n=1 Tax=Rathayibacter sp. VKM Ac-2759 TaxID=2609252 RepID=UPI0013198406|nr:bifunctional UDP-sugar hydrolase/5'-nucleotidase [Rathayibacter sp. VKM Ac-2759]QHC65339.1 bifunctional metallophosphatase/5'-nucleotidase [Rathayibacter sp. VKM Ac-2759]
MRSAPSGRSGLSRFLSAAAVSAVAGAALLGAAPAMAADETVIDVYTMNDFHGRLEATAGASVSQSTAGAASIASAFSTLEAENPDNSILVSAGDNVGASTFTSLVQDDNPTIDALNEIGLSASTIGNHELDHGREDLDGRIIPRADYEHISANLLEKGTDEHAYAPSYVQDFDGVKVGFVGAVTEDLPFLVSPDGIATLDVAPIVESVNEETARLQDGIDESADASIPEEQKNLEADVVIAVMHEGASSPTVSFTDPASVFGAIVDGIGGNVDAIVSGHTHQAYSQEVEVDGNVLPVLQTGSYGTYLGHLELTVDTATKDLTSITSNLVDLLQPVQVTNPTTGVVSTVYQPIYSADSTPVGQSVAALVQDAVDIANVEGAVSIGSVTGDIRRGVQSDGTENRGAESTIGNLVADAQLWATQAELGTQIAFMNPGGIRQDITYASSGEGDVDGNVTYREAAIVQPFANTLVTETLTGAQIKTVLEQQWQPTSSRPELHLGISADLSYTYDPTAEVGSHITGVFFQGEPIADEDTFKIVTNSFLAAGGDNFTELGNGTDKADSGRVDLNAFTEYMAEFSPVAPDPASRSIGVVETSAEGAETLSYDLSSLDVNNSPVRDDEVQVLIDGEQVTTAPIDHAIVDTTDEQGRASVSFSISELAAGDHELEFVLPTTGVSVLYTLTVTEAATPTPAPTPIETVIPTTPSTPAPAVHVPSTPTKHLAATGVDATPAFAAGIAALLLGLGMTTARLRRRAASK